MSEYQELLAELDEVAAVFNDRVMGERAERAAAAVRSLIEREREARERLQRWHMHGDETNQILQRACQQAEAQAASERAECERLRNALREVQEWWSLNGDHAPQCAIRTRRITADTGRASPFAKDWGGHYEPGARDCTCGWESIYRTLCALSTDSRTEEPRDARLTPGLRFPCGCVATHERLVKACAKHGGNAFPWTLPGYAIHPATEEPR